ncbi:MAG TPA: hypothetical protein VFL93_00825 [Longimicrobiaceae bacterium]|nr:hypothetical protein [Longimicrobiaceae bacterium]
MQSHTPEERQQYVDLICELAREWIVRREADFDVAIERGVEWCRNGATGDPMPRANPTITLTFTVNGGARETEGPLVLPSPPVFRGPEQ